MSAFSVDNIAKDVRIAIDENEVTTAFTDSEGNTFDPATLEMDDIIKSKIADGINSVRMIAPLHKLELTRVAPTVSWLNQSLYIGKVLLPEDFLRLALFKMSDWAYGVSQAISPSSTEYRQQFSKWGGVRGNPSRPVIAFSVDSSTGDSTIEFFSCDSTIVTAELSYVNRTEHCETSYEIEQDIYRAVICKTASLVLSTYGNVTLSQVLDSLCLENLGLASSKQQ